MEKKVLTEKQLWDCGTTIFDIFLNKCVERDEAFDLHKENGFADDKLRKAWRKKAKEAEFWRKVHDEWRKIYEAEKNEF